MCAPCSSSTPISTPPFSLPQSLQNSLRTAVVPWMPVLVPGGVDHLHQHPSAPRSLSTPRIHSEKNEHVPSITRKEFHMCVYTIRQVHHTIPSNSVSLYRIPHARLLNVTHVISWTSCFELSKLLATRVQNQIQFHGIGLSFYFLFAE